MSCNIECNLSVCEGSQDLIVGYSTNMGLSTILCLPRVRGGGQVLSLKFKIRGLPQYYFMVQRKTGIIAHAYELAAVWNTQSH